MFKSAHKPLPRSQIFYRYTICTKIHPLGTEYYEVHTFELELVVQSLMSLIKEVAKEMHAKFRL